MEENENKMAPEVGLERCTPCALLLSAPRFIYDRSRDGESDHRKSWH